MQNFRALGAPPPDLQPLASGGWGLRPQTHKQPPPLRISGYAPDVTASAQRRVQKFFYIFFTIIVGDFLFMNNDG